MITTCELLTTLQFSLGMYALHNMGRIEIEDVLNPDCSYGIDEESPIPQLEREDPVVVNPPTIELGPHQRIIIVHIRNVQSLTDDGNHGVTHYL